MKSNIMHRNEDGRNGWNEDRHTKNKANSRNEDVDKNEHMDWNEDGYKDGKGQAGVGSRTGVIM